MKRVVPKRRKPTRSRWKPGISWMGTMTITSEIYAALRARYAPPGFAIISEVADGTGAMRRRYADAVAMSLFPSRGLDLIGIEVKVSRADWLKELADPAKAEAVCRFCDRWFIAAGHAEVVRPNELPPTWGLLVLKNGALTCKVNAPQLQPEPITRLFLASLMRRSVEQSIDEKERARIKAEAFEAGSRAGRESAEKLASHYREELNKLAKKICEFEDTSGVRIDTAWHGAGKIGAAVKAVLDGTTPVERVEYLLREIDRVGDELRKVLNRCNGRVAVSPFANHEEIGQ